MARKPGNAIRTSKIRLMDVEFPAEIPDMADSKPRDAGQNRAEKAMSSEMRPP